MGRTDLIDRLQGSTQNQGYQVVLCDESGKLSRKIYKCKSLDEAVNLICQKKQEARTRKPRRNQYMIWLRKGPWNAVTIESGFLRK
jgi:hypothetical protein